MFLPSSHGQDHCHHIDMSGSLTIKTHSASCLSSRIIWTLVEQGSWGSYGHIALPESPLGGADKLIELKPILLPLLFHPKCWLGLICRFKRKILLYLLKTENLSRGGLVFNIPSNVPLAEEGPTDSYSIKGAWRSRQRHSGSFCWR